MSEDADKTGKEGKPPLSRSLGQFFGILIKAATAATLGAQLGKALLMGLELGAPLLAAGLVAAAARLAIGRLGARSLVLQHRLVSFGAVVVMCLLAMSGQIAAMARMMVR